MSFRPTPGKMLHYQAPTLGASMDRLVPGRSLRTWKNLIMQRGQSRVLAPEFVPGPGAGKVFTKKAIAAAPQNHVQPWHLTSGSNSSYTGTPAPTVAGNEVVLLSFVVPNGCTVVLNGHNQYLEDGAGVGVEEGLIWMLRVGGRDILNPFPSMNTTANPNYNGSLKSGRVIRANNVFVPFGPTKEDLPVIPAGTLVQYVVRAGANVALAGQASIAASLFMTLWGDKGT